VTPAGTVLSVFDEQVARTPDAPAVLFDGVRLSYRELDARANRLAHRLIRLGVTPEDRVGVLLERSAELVVAVLAVVKAGGAYLPLDLRAPAGRMRLVLDEADAGVLLTDRSWAATAADVHSGPRVVVDDDPSLPEEPAEAPDVSVHPDNLAYVEYTSGSTGVPKGVAVRHRDVLALAFDRRFLTGRHDRVLVHSPLAFDASTYELWVPLLRGGHVVVAPPGDVDGDTLRRLIAEYAVTGMFLTSGLFRIVAQDAPEALTGLQELLTGGEVVPSGAVRRVLAACPGLVVVNVYGPTETTTFATYHPMSDPATVPDRLPIGGPLDTMRAYVLDAHLRRVPPGVPGELFIAGEGLARGYLNRPALTAQRFVACPFGPPGDRMYRTGDVVRWSDTGVLEFEGRVDEQVKIRGFRVEPGEIEAVLATHPAVGQALVIAREDRPDVRRLVAYVVPADGHAPAAPELRTLVAERLPEYMVPSAFVTLDRLPVTANGKVDRRALPAPRYAGGTSRAPRSQRERWLCSLFAEILGVEQVGIDDSFLVLGGHSLLAIRLIARIRAALGVTLTVRDVFDAATVAALDRRLDTAPAAAPALRSRARPVHIPPSFSQRGLWFLDRVAGPGPTYNVPVILRLAGTLDRDALRAAVDDVVERHESLRTVFPDVDGEPVQRVTNNRPGWEYAPVPNDRLAERLDEAARYPFKLTEEIPLRAWLFEAGPDDHALLLLMHHIAVDGWSFGPLATDLGTAYAARLAGQPPAWPELPVQYADFALRQREFLSELADPDTRASTQLAFWTATLSGLPAELTLPYDRPRPATASHDGGTVRFRIDAAEHRGLAALADRCHASMFMVLQAAVAVLLNKLGAGSDVPIGTPVACRTDPALDDVIGLIANLVVLRTDLAGDPTFEELVGRVRGVDLDAFAHQELPFEVVVDAVNPARSLSRHPLTQIVITMDPDEIPVRLPGIVVESANGWLDVAKYDININFDVRRAAEGEPSGIVGLIGYSSDLFDRSTVQGFADRLVRIVTAVAVDGRQPLSRIDVLDPVERRRILVDWNDTAMAVPDHTLPVLLELQAARTPAAPAVQMADETLTYAELNERSNQVARFLISRGAGPESVVALMMPRSVGQIVALWGTLKAGAAYVPVDPSYPADRIAFMLGDAAPVLTLTEPVDATELPTANVTDADRIRPLLPWHPAYVCYTSGSTGVPKAAVMPASSMVNLMTWTIATFPPGRMAQFSSLSFDTSALEILAATVSGGCLVVPHEGVRRDAEELVRWLARHEVHELLGPNLVVEALCDAAASMGAELPALRRIAQGGEALVLSPRIREFFGPGHERRLINHYGPTETHLAVAHLLPSTVDEWPAEPPIGRPIANMRAYVLDPALQPVPAGVIGELYLAGAQLSRGYLNRPSVTASRFVANPFGPPGSRMYRTGDLVRWRSPGELVFAGRVDHQVKIHGYRIELGEIESVLREHPDVAQAAVSAVEGRPGVKRLVAYVVPVSGPVDPDALRKHVAAVLPEYMVPTAFVELESMPYNPNGKLDRGALPVPAGEASGRLPRTPLEKTLCEIYADVLGVPLVTIDDDFFALGGHSLNATKLISRIRTMLHAEVPLRALFEKPTPAGLAQRVAEADRTRNALERRARPERVPLSSAQLRLWFLHKLEGLSPTYNLPVMVRLSGDLDRDALRAALGDVVARHESLRTVFPDRDGEPYQRIVAAEPRWEFARIDETMLAARLAEAAGYTFDLAREIPLAAWLFEVGLGEHVLLVLMHHISSDGWSMTPLARDLSTAYGARLRGEPPAWPPLPVQYADYALWQRDSLASADLAFWTEGLAGLPEEVALPSDRPRPRVPSYQGGWVPLRLDHEVHCGLIELARRAGATPFMVMHAGLTVLLHRLGGGDDIPIGTVVAGRADEALDELVGFFVNTLVLRVDLGGDPTFADLLVRVREVDIAAFSHQDVQFEHLVEALNPPRLASRPPLFQVMLAFNNNEAPVFDLVGVTAVMENMGHDIARFDLTLNLWESFGPNGEPQGIEGFLQYSSDLFDHRSAQALAERLRLVYRAVVADPDLPIGTVDVRVPAAGELAPHRIGDPVDGPVATGADDDSASTSVSLRERVLCELFAEVLELPEVDPTESFFELGGHSLLVVRLISRVRAVLGVDLSVRDVFESSTVAGLARRTAEDSPGDSLAVMLPLRATGTRPPLFCVHPAAGTSWVYSGLLRLLDADQPIYGLQARALREPARMPASTGELVADYLAQIRQVQPHGPYALLGWSLGGLVAHLLAVELQRQQEDIRLLAVMDSFPPVPETEPSADAQAVPDEVAESIGQDLARAGLGEVETNALLSVFTNMRRLFADVSLGVFDGDLLLFNATADKAEDSPYTPDLWRPHVTGRVLTHAVDCDHNGMTGPEPMSHIGPVLHAALVDEQ
jgi:amino acid adenylation domain-containing protein